MDRFKIVDGVYVYFVTFIIRVPFVFGVTNPIIKELSFFLHLPVL